MSAPNPAEANAFTLAFPRLMPDIITDVGISKPFIPSDSSSSVVTMKALWDTGATGCCVTKEAAHRAGLPITGRRLVMGVHGSQERDVYFMNVVLPNQVMVSRVRAIECDAVAGSFDVIIGMSVITLGDFAISHPDEKTLFSFRIPSLEGIDFVEQAAEHAKRGAASADLP